MINKKNLCVLIAIPLYVLFCFVCSVFFEMRLQISHILCLSVFTLCASVFLAIENNKFKIICVLLIHFAVFATAFAFNELTGIVSQELFIYCLFCLPSLFFIYMFTDTTESGEKAHKKQEGNSISRLSLLFDVLIVGLSIILLINFFTGSESFEIGFDATAACFLLLLLLLLGFNAAMHFKKSVKGSQVKYFAYIVCFIDLFGFLVYIFFAHKYVQDKVYLLFTIVLSLIFYEQKYSVLKNVFPYLKK